MDSIILFAALTRIKNVRSDFKRLGIHKNTDKGLASSMLVLAESLVESLKAESGDGLIDGLSELEIAHMRNHAKIQAIKAYRERTGLGLAEAKQAVEAWGERNGVTSGNTFVSHWQPLPQKFIDKGYTNHVPYVPPKY